MTRLERLEKAGILPEILWSENKYPELEEWPGQFQAIRDHIETGTVEEVFDEWLRGHSIIGYSGIIINALDKIRKACKEDRNG